MYTKKHHRKSLQTKYLKRARAICNFDSFYNVALVLHENVLVFSRSEARNFLKYIIIVSTAICSFSMKDGNQSSDIQKTRFSITYKTY